MAISNIRIDERIESGKIKIKIEKGTQISFRPRRDKQIYQCVVLQVYHRYALVEFSLGKSKEKVKESFLLADLQYNTNPDYEFINIIGKEAIA